MDDVIPMAAGLTENQTWLVIGVSAALVIYLSIRSMGKKKRDPLSDRPLRMGLAQQKALERDMQNLLVELHEMARQMNAQVDTRAARLELLIQEAEEKIRRLEALSRDPASPLQPADAPPPTPTDRPVMRLAGIEPNLEAPDDRYAEIYRLAEEERLDARAIAARLGRPYGEVELILALRRRRSESDGAEPPAIALS